MKYAANTEVSTDRSRAEIERTLSRYGATRFAYGWDGNQAMIQFEMRNRRIRFILPMPTDSDPEVLLTPAGRTRSDRQIMERLEQAKRQHWRALLLSIKAKLESVEAGIEEFEEAFLAQIVLPDNTTVGDWVAPQIEGAYQSKQMPPMLPAPAQK